MCLSFINFFPEKLSKFLTNLTIDRNTSTFPNNEVKLQYLQLAQALL